MSFIINTPTTITQSLTGVLDVGVVTNNGALITPGTSINITGGGAFVVNDGLINALSFCINGDADFSLMNRGLMTTESLVISIDIANTTTTTTSITNSGDIVSTLSSVINCAEAGLTLQNSGLISGRSTAISLTSSELSVTSRINNSGSIEVQPTSTIDTAILCNGTLRLINTGLILGVINLGDGNDTVDNRVGTILGEIQLDDGSNLFLGGALGEDVSAGIGSDTIRGEGGDDEIASSWGNDLVRGGLGDDSINGSLGFDSIYGGLGDDTILGGGEADLLHGGAGKDVFLFNAPGDSDTGQISDQIMDFRRGDDLIDLSGFAPTIFDFVGTGPFTGNGTASFSYFRVPGNLLVSADLNGDALMDFQIEVFGTRTLATTDFVL